MSLATATTSTPPEPTLAARLRRRVTTKRDLAALLRELGEHMGGAARDPANLVPRPCPVCDADDPEPRPAVAGPVYRFHRCRGCSLVYAPRLLRPETTRRLYGERPIYRGYWEHMRADAEAMLGRPVYAALVRHLAALAPGRRAAIDVGCHFGKLVDELEPYFDEAIGLELNRRTAQAGSRLFGVTILPKRLEDLDRPAGSVDLIVMNQILEHLTVVRPVLEAALRLLAPGGVLYVSIPHGASAGMRLRGGRHPFVATHMHLNLFTAASLRRLVVDAGFEVERLGTDDDVDLPVADWVLERIPPGASLLALPALALDKAVRVAAARAALPSRLGLGAHLEAILRKPRGV